METRQTEIPAQIARLVVVSDLHAFIEPLEALDRILDAQPEPTQVIVAGDILYGGANPLETLDWVRRRAGGLAVTGNHDDFGDDGARRPRPEPQPIFTEAGALQRMDAAQRAYFLDLPRMLDLRWRGQRLRILHGHKLMDWKTTPARVVAQCADPAFALTVVGHTHFPFVRAHKDVLVANAGTTCLPIFGWMRPDGLIVSQDDDPLFVSRTGVYSSYLAITVQDGALHVTVEPFDFDRNRALERLHAAGDTRTATRSIWMKSGVYCFEV